MSSPLLSDLPPHPHHTGHTSTGRPHTRGTLSRPSWPGTPAPPPQPPHSTLPLSVSHRQGHRHHPGGGEQNTWGERSPCALRYHSQSSPICLQNPVVPFLGHNLVETQKQKQTASKTANFPLSNLWAWLPICSCQGATSFGDQSKSLRTLPPYTGAFVLPLISHTHKQRSLWGWETPNEPGHVLQTRTEDPQS